MKAPLRAVVLTFNCARTALDPHSIGTNIFAENSSIPPDLLVLCLQEVAPIAQSFMGDERSIHLRPFLKAVHDAAKIAGSPEDPYQQVSFKKVGMTAIAVFALSSHRDNIKSIEAGGTGFGVAEMGNKGAVGIRLGWTVGSSTRKIAFIASHLAPHEPAFADRNRDWKATVERFVFSPVDQEPPHGHSNEGIFAKDTVVFLAGDLNYRTSDRRPEENEYLKFPQTQTELDELRKNDQLTRELRASNTLHGLSEHPISFPPTYKYDHKRTSKSLEYPWAKHRFPSWCDRILFSKGLTTASGSDTFHVRDYRALPIQQTSDHRPVALDFEIDLDSDRWGEITGSSPPFGIDPEWHAKRVAARRLEVLVGTAAYLTTTQDGYIILTALAIGTVGGYFLLTSLLM